MKNNEVVTTQPNSNTIKIPICVAIIMSIIWVAAVAWWLWYAREKITDPYRNIHDNLPNVIGALSSLTLLVFGAEVARNGAFNKGGTVYYPRSYSIIRVTWETRKTRKKYKRDRSEILKTIQNLSDRKDDKIKQFQTPYFLYIYELQSEKDFTFHMAWNNFNYYHGMKYKGKLEYNHYKDVEFYVYCRVYEKHRAREAENV